MCKYSLLTYLRLVKPYYQVRVKEFYSFYLIGVEEYVYEIL